MNIESFEYSNDNFKINACEISFMRDVSIDDLDSEDISNYLYVMCRLDKRVTQTNIIDEFVKLNIGLIQAELKQIIKKHPLQFKEILIDLDDYFIEYQSNNNNIRLFDVKFNTIIIKDQ
ncbi:hypothetical protein [Aquimarina sp. 2304DJ70-9]|uniref:hypothetical protein n=1 Tax=Aquimarina penaris TaxID=3231044 RepID=UPI0034627890